MKTQVYLDKFDTARIVAHHYNIKPQDVIVHCFNKSVGYGMDEHEEPDMEVIVTTGEEVMSIDYVRQ